jgi:competence protein ComGC
MLIPKILFRLLLIFLSLIICIFLLILIDSPSMINSQATKILCENRLKIITKAINLYQTEWDGQWPVSLLKLGPYYDDPNRIPRCPGDRNEQETHDSSEYYYFPPKTDEIVPVCWDSKPHRTKSFLLPDTFLWNVLYSDGNIKRLNKRKMILELSRLAKTNPDVLKVLNLLGVKNNEN